MAGKVFFLLNKMQSYVRLCFITLHFYFALHSTLGEPVGASLLAIVFLNEMLTLVEVFGGSLIIVGIYLFLKLQSGTKQAKTLNG